MAMSFLAGKLSQFWECIQVGLFFLSVVGGALEPKREQLISKYSGEDRKLPENPGEVIASGNGTIARAYTALATCDMYRLGSDEARAVATRCRAYG